MPSISNRQKWFAVFCGTCLLVLGGWIAVYTLVVPNVWRDRSVAFYVAFGFLALVPVFVAVIVREARRRA